MNVHRLYGRISPYFRRRRLRQMQQHLEPIERLLDVGGYPWCWEETPLRPANITLLNPDTHAAAACRDRGFTFVAGDGCALPFPNASFDVVFSNSVIEHVGTWERQQAFAAEARRVGRRLWIQTPAREFFPTA